MNIGIDIRPLLNRNKTGVGEYTFELLNAIFKIDKINQYYLFYNCSKNLRHQIEFWQQNNIHYVKTAYPNKLLNLGLASGLVNLDNLLKTKIDYWFCSNLNFFNTQTPYLLTIHDLTFNLFPQFYTLKQRLWHRIINPKRQCQNAALILAPSHNTKRDLINYYQIPAEKIKVIYPGINPNFLAARQNLAIDQSRVIKKYNLPENFLLFFGAIEPRKNIASILKAYEKLPKYITEKYSLIIAGASGWKNKKIYSLANQSPLQKQIKFLGYIAEADKPALYSLSTLFIFNSFYEGFGFPIIEAMSMGVPAIASNRSSLAEIAGNSAYLVNPNNPVDLKEAIKNLLTDSELKNLYIKNGRLLAVKFSWEESAKQWLESLNHLNLPITK